MDLANVLDTRAQKTALMYRELKSAVEAAQDSRRTHPMGWVDRELADRAMELARALTKYLWTAPGNDEAARTLYLALSVEASPDRELLSA